MSESNKSCRYYVYCHDILGVETNIKNFRWIYGSYAHLSTCADYERCVIKFRIILLKDSELENVANFDDRFQSFLWRKCDNTLFYRRQIAGFLSLGYTIRFGKDITTVFIGRNYYNFVKGRIMNLHGIFYLLSDLANIMLQDKGYFTLYASAVLFEEKKRGIVFFAPPNTGKTMTATKLSAMPGIRLVGEDIVITDSKSIFACPYTQSYRKKNRFDSGGSFGRVKVQKRDFCVSCSLTDLVLLSLGKNEITNDKVSALRRINALNGYLFSYSCSPIVKVLAYFDKKFANAWNNNAEHILSDLIYKCNCTQIRVKSPEDYIQYINTLIEGGEECES